MLIAAPLGLHGLDARNGRMLSSAHPGCRQGQLYMEAANFKILKFATSVQVPTAIANSVSEYLSLESASIAMPAESVPILYGNAGSSCTARLRIALNLKGIKYDAQSVDVRMSVEYQKLNPQRLVPLYVTKEASISQRYARGHFLDFPLR